MALIPQLLDVIVVLKTNIRFKYREITVTYYPNLSK